MTETGQEEKQISEKTIKEASKQENTQSLLLNNQMKEDSSFWSGYLSSVGIILLLLGFLYALLYFLKKQGNARFNRLSSSFSRQDLKVEAQLPLAPKKTLYVVKYLNKRLLIGSTDSSLTLLSEDYIIPEAVSENDTNSSRPEADKESVKAFDKLMKAFSKEENSQG